METESLQGLTEFDSLPDQPIVFSDEAGLNFVFRTNLTALTGSKQRSSLPLMMKSPRYFAAVVAFCLTSVAAIAADPSGTYTFLGLGGLARPQPGNPVTTLVLALKEGKLTGSLTTSNYRSKPAKYEITDASLSGDTVSFLVTFEGSGNTAKFSGKVRPTEIVGTITVPERSKQALPAVREWIAEKSK